MESLGLQGRYRAQEALLDGGIGQPHQVNPDTQGNVYFHGNRNRPDTHAFGAVNIDNHGLIN